MVTVFVAWLTNIVVETFEGRSQRVMKVTLAMGGCLCDALGSAGRCGWPYCWLKSLGPV